MQKRQKRASEKRTKLVKAGSELFHTKGYDGTSLANVAKAAGLPPGGIFYYFPTKTDLADAVMGHHADHFGAQLQAIEAQSQDARTRLRLFWDQAETLADNRAMLGCPVLALAEDMAADPTRPDDRQKVREQVMRMVIDWLTVQYQALGLSKDMAQQEAAGLFAAMQGAFAVGHVLGDSKVIHQLFERERTLQEKADYR